MNSEDLKSKAHRAVIREANLHYVDRLTFHVNLVEAANMIENGKFQAVEVNEVERIETYLIKGKRESGVCCLNSPATRW
ncbi:MAG: aspartate 1-decarboxylase [Chitinophagaceae bacterium]